MRNVGAVIGAFIVGGAVVACGASTPPSSSAPTTSPVAAQTSASATATTATARTTAPAARTSPGQAATATRQPGVAEVILRWDAGAIIADVDDVSDMVTHLKNTPGIVDGFGDETQITLLYEPQRITVERIRQALADMGFPTVKP